MTIRDIIIKYSQELENISDTPRLDVEILLEKALGNVDSLYIRLNLNKELTQEQEDLFNTFIQDRLKGRPVAYIVGNREFMGLDFYVQEGVLIPRPDTEPLVEEIIELCKSKENLSILDIGTGSGILSIAASIAGASIVDAVDIRDITDEVLLNSSLNNLENITPIVGNILDDSSLITNNYDWIFINIGGEETKMFMNFIKTHLNTNGTILVSGLVEWSFDEIKENVESYGFKLQSKHQTNEWVTAIFK